MNIIYWITVIALSLFVFLGIFVASICFMKEEHNKCLEHLFRTFGYAFLLFAIIYLSHAYSNSGYDQGQKDAAMGKQKYACLMDTEMNKYVVEKK